ncbi:hypothetical protein LguiA_036262 [Lonicera macranthoides]
MSYIEMRGLVEDLGYNNIAKLYYLIHRKSTETGLRLIDSDKDISEMVVCVKVSGGIEIYIEHDQNGKRKAVEYETVKLNMGDELADEINVEFDNDSDEESENDSIADSVDTYTDNDELVDLRKKLNNGCPWRSLATYMQNEESFQTKSLKNNHKCIRNFKIKLANFKWLTKQYEKKIIGNPKWKLKDFKADVLEKYSINVSLVQCYRAKKIASSEVELSLIDHYGQSGPIQLWKTTSASNPIGTPTIVTNPIGTDGS